MKKLVSATLVTAALALTACQPEAIDPLKVEVVTLQTEEQKQAYAMGANIGTFVSKNLEEQEKLSLPLDKELLLKGFIAAMQDQSQMTPEEIQTQTQALQTKFAEAKKAQDEVDMAANVEAGKKFLEDNAQREGVTVTESGLQYEVLAEGEGDSPAAEDTVKVHYTGTLLDGTVFDSSVQRNEPASFPLNRVIKGWTEGVQLMKPGSKFKFFIPSELAYGQRATGKITPNSTLIFEVELLEVTPAS